MKDETRQAGLEALRRLDRVIAEGSDVAHEDVHAAVVCVVALRNRILAEHRETGSERSRLDQANALVSLAYGAEFPLTGFHLRRFEGTRDGIRALLEQP
jgi:hypothetical protein